MIETLAQHVLGALQIYGKTLWSIWRAPVTWTAEKARRSDSTWPALQFWAVSLAIYILTRHLMFGQKVEAWKFAVSLLFSNGLSLILIALSFFLAWRLFRAELQMSSILSATAYCWGAYLPVQIVSGVVIMGAIRTTDPATYALTVNFLLGCGDLIAALDNVDAFRNAVSQAWVGFLTASVLLLIDTLIGIVFLVAYIRVMARLNPIGVPRLLGVVVLAALLSILGISLATAFGTMLIGDGSGCLTSV